MPKTPIFKCRRCAKYYDNNNIYFHMLNAHQIFMCIKCGLSFYSIDKLAQHLEFDHDQDQHHHATEESFRATLPLNRQRKPLELRILMCCKCKRVLDEAEPFTAHECMDTRKTCQQCGQIGRHTHQCRKQMKAAKRLKKLNRRQGRATANRPGSEARKVLSPMPQQQQQQEAAPMMAAPPPAPVWDPVALPTTPLVGVESTPAPPVDPSTRAPLNEDSNSSCNMVIDESCNAQHHATPTVNPFKVLDERERQEQLQEQIKVAVAEPAMPPDRLPHDVHCFAPPPPPPVAPSVEHLPEPAKPQRVMLKLRVPKEYQKPVDDDISSVDSFSGVETDGDAEEEDVDVEHTEAAEMRQQSLTEAQQFPWTARAESDGGSDESQDDASKDLERVLQEIEQTKLDIQRAKDYNRHMSSVPPQEQQEEVQQPVEPKPELKLDETKEESPLALWSAASRTEEKEDPKLVEPASVASPQPVERTLADDEKEAVQILDELKYAVPLDEPLQKVDSPVAPPMEGPATAVAVDEPATRMEVDKPAEAKSVAVDEPIAVEEPATSAPESSVGSLEAPAPPMALDEPPKSVATPIDQLATSVTPPVDQLATSVAPPIDQLATSVAPPVDQLATSVATPVDQLATSVAPPVDQLATSVAPPVDQLATSVAPPVDQLATSAAQAVATPPDLDDTDIDVVRPPSPPADGIELANEDTTVLVELQLQKPLDQMEPVEFVRQCVGAVRSMCLYCRHARRIAVHGRQLVLHLLGHHRFAATVDSITAEELRPDTIQAKLKSYLPLLTDQYFNSSNYCTVGDGALRVAFNEREHFECFECRNDAATHKELYSHNRKMHLHQPIMCFMCRTKFFNFSDLLCHLCPGALQPEVDLLYRCCLCEITDLPSPFRLMVHLRMRHHTCDVCLEDCQDQGRLAQHVWKHKQQHRCFRCNIGYRNKEDITRHLFWKHGTESVNCKSCLLKRWPHVYHFCLPKAEYACDACPMTFPRATHLQVHRRIHQGELPHSCTQCEEKFISRGLLAKHVTLAHPIEPVEPEEPDLPKNEPEPVPEASPEASEPEVKVTDDAEAEKPAPEISPPLVEDKEGDATETSPVDAPEAKPLETAAKQEDSKPDLLARLSKSQPASRRCSVTETKVASPVKKRKKQKECLDDLNLIVPNLSESDSSDSDNEAPRPSKPPAVGGRPKSEGDEPIVPRVMLSPPSEADSEASDGEESSAKRDHAISIWQNYFKSQGDTEAEKLLSTDVAEVDYTEDNYPQPQQLHVVVSDHDYSSMKTPPPPPPKVRPPPLPVREPSPVVEVRQRKNSNASSTSTGSSSSSSAGSSDSSSAESSSSEGSSNCSDGSDSSARSNGSAPRKRIRKKSERDQKRKKSLSVSPAKRLNRSAESAIAEKEDDKAEANAAPLDPVEDNEPAAGEPVQPFHPSDFETEVSETDEEFYDAKPSKFAPDAGRVLEKPSFAIPQSNTSAFDDAAGQMNGAAATIPPTADIVPPAYYDMPLLPPQSPQPLLPPPPPRSSPPGLSSTYALYKKLSKASNGLGHAKSRMSEGSSCSDADGPLKRSKRIRRPNRLYCDDEYEGTTTPAAPVRLGHSTYNPGTPPEFTWDKDDLPSPPNRLKNARKRKPESTSTPNSSFDLGPTASKKRRHANTSGKQSDTPPTKQFQLSLGSTLDDRKFPPIPTLKIRSAKFANSSGGTTIAHHATSEFSTQRGGNNIPKGEQSDTTDDDDDDYGTLRKYSLIRKREITYDSDSSDSLENEVGKIVELRPKEEDAVLPQVPVVTTECNSKWLEMGNDKRVLDWCYEPVMAALPVRHAVEPEGMPPVPQAKAFNNNVPPALMPNPDIETLNYFRANNIRYPVRPPVGARRPRGIEPVYCYCRCPYDEVSEMIACDGRNCAIEWFHFECVGIIMAPQGKWFCAECRPRYRE